MTRLSIVIPTQGRKTLQRCLDSCLAAGFERHRDELIVVGDEHGPPIVDHEHYDLLQVEQRLCAEYGARYIGLDAGHHCWGHCSLNAGIDTIILGDYIVCQDDDDAFTPDAFTRIREQADFLSQPRPLLFRFRAWYGTTYWDTPGIARENHIGGHCAVFPNDERLGRFTCRYQGDYDYIRSTLDNWGGDDQAVWVDDVIAIARPQEVPA